MTDFRDDSFEELERLFKSQYEVALVKELSHPNVVKLLDVFCSTKKLVLVFEFLEHDLKKYMKSVGRALEPKIIQCLSYQLCDGIQFCHANRLTRIAGREGVGRTLASGLPEAGHAHGRGVARPHGVAAVQAVVPQVASQGLGEHPQHQGSWPTTRGAASPHARHCSTPTLPAPSRRGERRTCPVAEPRHGAPTRAARGSPCTDHIACHGSALCTHTSRLIGGVSEGAPHLGGGNPNTACAVPLNLEA
mmetsp:Transcript_114443/g.363742  ORF Transcript_114443/g.363742 Transcript_114443/m.363742 type:complete len:248 (-) Transcript_114443:104-847(-)